MKKVFNLQAIYSPRKSFYGKAKVVSLDEHTHALYSYGGPVAAVKDNQVILLSDWCCSTTTSRHVHEFLAQFAFGFDAFTANTIWNSIKFFRGDYVTFRSWGFDRTY